MNLIKYPIIIISIFIIIGIILADLFLVPKGYIYIFIALSFSGMLIAYYISLKKIRSYLSLYFFVFLIVNSFFIGILLQKRMDKRKNISHYTNHVSKGKPNLIELEIKQKLKPTQNYANYIARIKKVNRTNTSGKILLKKKSDKNPLLIGEKIMIYTDKNNLRSFKKSLNPYTFNYKKYMERKNIYHFINLSNTAYKKTNKKSPFSFLIYGERIRNYIKYIFRKNGLKNQEYQLASSLLIGDRTLLDKELIQNFQKAGTIHILAISGLHIGILLLFLNFIFKGVKKKMGNVVFLILILGILWFYAFITGFSPSVLRAVIMFSFLQIAYQLKRNSNIYNTLFVAALFMIIFNPSIIYEVGFQLSFAAVLGIVGLFPLLSKPIKKWTQPWKWIAELLLISLTAQLGILPLSLYYFHQFPVFFFVANLIIIPLLFVLLFVGFSLILIGSIGLAPSFLWKFFSLLLHSLIEINNSIAHWHYSLITNIHFDMFKVVLGYLILFMFYAILSNKRKVSYVYSLFLLIIAFQIHVLNKKWQKRNEQNLLFLQQYNLPIMAYSKGEEIRIYNSQKKINPYLMKALSLHYKRIEYDSIDFFLEIKKLKIVKIDSLGIWDFHSKLSPDIVLLSNSPKINLDRLIKKMKPKILIASGANYPTFIERWKRSCEENNVLFRNTNEYGAITIKLPYVINSQ